MIIKEKKHNDGELKFSEIDEPLKQHYIRLFITLLFSFFVELIVSIVEKSLDVFLFCSVFILIYTIILLIQVYRILSGNVYSYTGECADIHFKSKKKYIRYRQSCYKTDRWYSNKNCSSFKKGYEFFDGRYN